MHNELSIFAITCSLKMQFQVMCLSFIKCALHCSLTYQKTGAKLNSLYSDTIGY